MLKTQKSMQPTIMQQQSKVSQRIGVVLALLGIVAGLWTATQVVAHIFNYQAVLGHVLWGHLYAPWAYLDWYFSWGEHIKLMRAAGSAGMLVANAMLFVVWIRQTGNPEAVAYLHGSARWAEAEDIRKAGLFSNDGVYVGGWEAPNGKMHYLRHDGSEHLLCIAPTRSGKGICLVVPTLLSWAQSCVVTDLKGELVALTAGWRRKYANNTVLIFEPAAEFGSAHWNPLDEIRIGNAYEMGDAQNLATLIVDPNGHGLKDHWQKTSQALFVGCILHVLYMRERTGSEASLTAVDAMLADPSKDTMDLWDEMKTAQHYADGGTHPAVAKAAQDMLDRPEQERGSVLSTAKSYLALFRDPVVARNTKDSDFKISHLMRHDSALGHTKPVSLYIVTQPTDKERLKPLVRILINMICRLLASKMQFEIQSQPDESMPQKLWRWARFQKKPLLAGRRAKSTYNHRLLMMLDEFPSLGKLGIIQESLAFLAGYGIRFYLICQDTTQLKGTEFGYGAEESVSSNCHIQNAFQPNRQETAEYLSKLTGTTTIVKEQVSISGSRFGALNQVSKVLQEISRPLMTPDECLRMEPPVKDGDKLIKGGKMLIYVAGFPAIMGQQMPYFQDPVFCARSRVDPPAETDRIRQPPLQILMSEVVERDVSQS